MSQALRDDVHPLFVAISLGKVRQAANLIDELENIDIRDSDRKTPLIHAVCLDISDLSKHFVRMLIQKECDVNATDKFGRTALMYATFKESRLDTMRILSRAVRCDPNISDRDGNCALMHAAIAGNYSAVRVLVNSSHFKGILNVNLRNKQNLSPVEYAFKLRNTRCCRILVKEGNAQTGCIRDKDELTRILGDDDPAFVKRAEEHVSSTSNTFLLSTFPPNQTRNPNKIDLNASLDSRSRRTFRNELRNYPEHSKRKLSPIMSRAESSQEFPKSVLTKLPSISPRSRVNLVASNNNSLD